MESPPRDGCRFQAFAPGDGERAVSRAFDIAKNIAINPSRVKGGEGLPSRGIFSRATMALAARAPSTRLRDLLKAAYAIAAA
jgi:hypothetical protein